MDLIFKCPKCGQELEVDASGAGEEIACPSCSGLIRIPESETARPAPESAVAEAGEQPAPGGWAPGGQHGGTINSSAAAKVKMHLKVPVHATPSEKLIAKALVPLEVAAKESDRHLRVKCIRHVDCVEVGHDRFDETVTAFLGKVGEPNVVSITTISYSIVDVATQKLVTDYGVMIVFRG
jgi:DNA-directed RNA polymerase subunit RPC12/RpoP